MVSFTVAPVCALAFAQHNAARLSECYGLSLAASMKRGRVALLSAPSRLFPSRARHARRDSSARAPRAALPARVVLPAHAVLAGVAETAAARHERRAPAVAEAAVPRAAVAALRVALAPAV